MDDMEEKINAFLSNPEAMEKVMGMAQALGLGGGAAAAPQAQPPQASPHPAPEKEQPSVLADKPDGLGALFGGLQNMDPKMLSGLMNLVGAYSGGDDRREAVLLSIKPYLRNERQAKLERVSQMMRIARTARLGFKTFLGGGKDA